MFDLCPKCNQRTVCYDRVLKAYVCRNFFCDYAKPFPENEYNKLPYSGVQVEEEIILTESEA